MRECESTADNKAVGDSESGLASSSLVRRLAVLWEKLKFEATFGLLWLVSTILCATARFRVEGWERMQRLLAEGRGGVVALWHGSTTLPIYYCRNMSLYSIVSLSKDGELQHRILRSRGFLTIRGSSARRGAQALLEAVRRLREGYVLAVTPDGPRGPARKVQPGTIHLAQRSGAPVLPVGVACRPCLRAPSWDSHLIPAPFAQVVLVFGEPLEVSPEESVEEAARRVEDSINAAERRAWELISKPKGSAQ
ncbi:MAG: lysophospholipid acyltransferase family protein [Armatimonadota bacterium]|nr:lysophospholipid acyltransferase family protein [Armatimonadota bacterium]